jgi:hypothetical protein
MLDRGNRCSIVTLTSAPPSMNGRWSIEGDSIGSSSADAIVGRWAAAWMLARPAAISARRSRAMRTTSVTLSGDGS